MQHMMDRWIEAADARAVCEQEMARQMLAQPPAPDAQKSVLAMLRLQLLIGPKNWYLGLGQAARPSC